MGLFGNLRKKKLKETSTDDGIIRVAAPVSGTFVKLENVKDEAFSQGVLGPGCAIEPDADEICAPMDGTVTAMAETGHAVGLTGQGGVEVLIHVGMDTVQLNGKHFEVLAAAGQQVKKGDVLVRFDRKSIQAEGYDLITPVVIANADDFQEIKVTAAAGSITAGDPLLEVRK